VSQVAGRGAKNGEKGEKKQEDNFESCLGNTFARMREWPVRGRKCPRSFKVSHALASICTTNRMVKAGTFDFFKDALPGMLE